MDFGKAVARIALFSLAMCIFCAGAYGQPETRSICVAPMPRSSIEIKERCAPGLCGKGKLSLRIDRQPVRSWPTSQSIKITELNATARHRVVIYEDGKAQQSFTFRFSEFQSSAPCLFLNDLYWTAQLWEEKNAPWCKCK